MGGVSTDEERYAARLRDLEQAARRLESFLTTMIGNLELAQGELGTGQSLEDLVVRQADDDGKAFRRDVRAATREFERRLQLMRGEAFRVLVDSGRFGNISGVARHAGISVQMVRRLYEIAAAEDPTQ